MQRRKDQPPFIDMDSSAELSLRSQVAVPGMSDHERLSLLTSPSAVVPPRRIVSNSEGDPFGLLANEDTYGALASSVFKECEGIYYQLARVNPDVQKQYARAARHPKSVKSITLPTITLGSLYAFNMTKTATDHVEQYTFRRQDGDSGDKGFLVMRNPFGSFVLKRLNHPDQDMDDAEYFGLLRSAQAWVEDYAAKLNIAPRALLEFAENPPIPRTAMNIARGALLTAFTVKDKRTGDPKRPRYGALLAAACLIPVSSHEVAAEVAAVNTWHAVNGVLMASSHHHAAQKRAAAAKAAAAVKNFDAYNLQLPPAATSVEVGQSALIAYEPNLNPAIENAPAYPNKAALGNIRHLTNIDRVYEDGFDGLTPHACGSAVAIALGESAVHIVNVAPGSQGKLSVALSNNQLEVCNSSASDLTASDLDGLYIQPK